MRRCSKCGLEKTEDSYQTYYHSKLKKSYTRRECTECFYKTRKNKKVIEDTTQVEIIQPEVPELEIDLFENNPDYKKCRGCQIYKPLTEYYGKIDKKFSRCKQCELEKERKERDEYNREKGGSYKVLTNPNTFTDEYQREATHGFLLALGWKQNEETTIWYKDGIRNKDGEFLKVKIGKVKETRKRKN